MSREPHRPAQPGDVVTYTAPDGQVHEATLVRYADPPIHPVHLALRDGPGTQVVAHYDPTGTGKSSWRVAGVPALTPSEWADALAGHDEIETTGMIVSDGALPTVVCVLRSGGIYDQHWVRALRRGVHEWLPGARVVCMADTRVPCEQVPLRHNWPGWWAKMELFRPDVFDGPVLFFDLDTLFVGGLSEIAAYRGPFALNRNFYAPADPSTNVMAWTPGPHTVALYELFAADPEAMMATNRGVDMFMRDHASAEALHELFPGQIVSYKVDAQKGAPPGARVICGHGDPRFNSRRAGWAHAHWLGRAIGVAVAP